MFARITPYKLKPGMIEAATAKAEELKDRIMALDGIVEFINAVDADGNGYVVSLNESQERSDANQAQSMAIWGEMAEFLAEMPTPGGYDVKMHWGG